MQSLFDDNDDTAGTSSADAGNSEEPFVLSSYAPPTAGETVRQTGLAWSAGIAFFGAIMFMLFLGWLVDLLIGSSPWGIVGGIILGSIIGFMQFFRITSQIFGSNSSAPAEHPLLPDSEEPVSPIDTFDKP